RTFGPLAASRGAARTARPHPGGHHARRVRAARGAVAHAAALARLSRIPVHFLLLSIRAVHDVRGGRSTRRARATKEASMTLELGIILLLFATVGFAGAGSAIALARSRALDADPDLGMLGVAALLL